LSQTDDDPEHCNLAGVVAAARAGLLSKGRDRRASVEAAIASSDKGLRLIEQRNNMMNKGTNMKHPLATAALTLVSALAAPYSHSQIAGATTVGIETTQVQIVTAGWSAKKHILGKIVYNPDGEQVGKIDDIIIAPGGAISNVVIGAGGFVGLRRHHVAIPSGQLYERDGGFVLPGATKGAIRALPAFEYAKRQPARADQPAAPRAGQ
jgi:PRC-barrel domain